MKKYIILALLMSPLFCFSQNKREVSFWGGQIGILEGKIYNEINFSTLFSLKTSIGLVGGIDNSDFFLSSRIELNPKWNYNKNKRFSNNKNILYNSSNYISLNTSYTPKWATLDDYKDRDIEKISIIPTFGIKRNFNKNINYEFFFGIGYERFLNTKTINSKENKLGIQLGALIGFDL